MKTWRSWIVAGCLALAASATAACSDDNGGNPDARPTMTPDSPPTPLPDAPVATFATEVIDLITNKTADNLPAGPVDFQSAGTEDANAFDSLF